MRASEIGRRTVSSGDRISIDDRMTPASIDARRSIHGSWSVEDLRSAEGSEGRVERIVAPRIDPCAVEYIVRCVPKSPAESAKLEPAPSSGSDNPPTRPDLYAARAQGVRVVRRRARALPHAVKRRRGTAAHHRRVHVFRADSLVCE